jgi:hypothetical protein
MRAADAARLALGVTLVARPDLPQKTVSTRAREHRRGSTADPRMRRLIQALGARYVLQGLAGAVVRRRCVPAADATVDLIHAASMVTLAHFIPAHRRLATTSAGAACLFAVADLRATVHLTPGPDPEATARRATRA